ncbi:leucine--tRNA ligase [Candidatus Daviesbacteria bacterium]|nr:leucine--tRNA ligase [Candidatus Daviesbacteria bacterium]
MHKYIPSQIEPKWQKKWEKGGIHETPDISDKPKKYVLDMFPYPSGDGLHVGHFKGYVASDVISRYFRFKGYNVLHPMGWDAFGLPAENYAIKMGIHPSITTAKNIANIKNQMQMVSLSYDWNREINTTDLNYYKWTQWIFIKLFEEGLAYEDDAPINWCPKDKTGLANEEVLDGKCVRCGTKVEQKKIRQWILKITKYAEKLLEDLESLDWPPFIKEMQVNWIGKKEGINISYEVEGSKEKIVCFTTRPDTNFGATFIVLGPEHPLIKKITKKEHLSRVNRYIEQATKKSELDRIAEGRKKTGEFIGSYAINNLNGKKLPIWVSDFVLGNVGTGAVVGVPGHDIRDFEFAREFKLSIVRVVVGKDGDTSAITRAEQVQEKEGTMVNSEFLDGMDIHEATIKIMNYLEEKGWGERVTTYHLRDWIFSRQRYWGEPIPLVHCEKCGVVAIPEDQLPLKLPDVEKYEPTGTGESPLAAIPEWVNTTCPKCDGPARRESNTMPQWAGSCWYYLRFIDPKNDKVLVDKDKEKYWMPVDWYIGGAEHAVLHLLYARFWHKVLFDIGVISTKEPFQKLSSVGLVLAADGRKMSKSLDNVITPNEIVKEYGADTLRLYEAFMGPFENTISWDPTSINGVYKFLNRVWEVINKEESNETEIKVETALNKLIVKVAKDIEVMKFNTAVASMMEFINLVFHSKLTNDQKRRLLIVLAPFAPHITEELWEMLRGKYSIHQQSWPKFDNKYLEEEETLVVVQVNGKVRDTILIQKDIINNKEIVQNLAIASKKAQKFLAEKSVKKTIYVPGKIISFVTSS